MTRRHFLKSTLWSGLVLVAGALRIPRAKGAEAATAMTLDDLNAAWLMESKAQVRYGAYAKRAEEEGFAKIAQLFRALAESARVRATDHAEVIKKKQGTPEPLKEEEAEVGTTRENLESTRKAELEERAKFYADPLTRARQAADKDAVRAFNYALAVDGGMAKQYQAALDKPDAWKSPGKGWWVCQVCGYMVEKISFLKCPICFNPKEKYVLVK